MQSRLSRPLLALSIAAALAAFASGASAEQAWARVISATPVNESTGNIQYNVVYEYGGRQYTTRTDSRPGASIAIDVGSYGVATSSPVPPQPAVQGRPMVQGMQGGQQDWDNVAAEPGVVVSSGPAPVYRQPVPVYSTPAPVYYAPPYYAAPVYGYPAPYVYPPVGLSLNLGYSRGWGGHRHGHWR
ncbi:PXPV repeat-containing protein [Burkholderiales bacterium 8X]|nr:PXPV repeat-containing protein [Burkholderiales bacterium 8X]